MARRNKKKQQKTQKNSKKSNLGTERPQYPFLTSRLKRWIIVILTFVFALIISFSLLGEAGAGGRFLVEYSRKLFGVITSCLLPFILVAGGFLLWKTQKKRIFAPIFSAILLLIFSLAALSEILEKSGKGGGFFGYILSWPFLKFFGELVSLIIFSAVALIALLILWEFAPKKPKSEPSAKESKKEEAKKEKEEKKIAFIKTPEFKIKKLGEEKKKEAAVKPGVESETETALLAVFKGEYKTPPLTLFSGLAEKPSSGDTNYAAMMIKKTLADFGIMVEMGEINVGPTVTQYTFKPAEGIKLSKITALTNDLALALAAHPLRIEAPIPGRSLVGVEVPNKTRANVLLRELISLPQFQEAVSPLTFPLGKDVAGTPVFASLEKMPHLLVAGSTGSGKTIFLQNLIVSLIFRNSPQILRMILVDPKRVEFSLYENLPHLLAPVIFDASRTVNALNWLIGEMERRFSVLSVVKARDISSFNALVSQKAGLREEYGIMPFIVLIVDELADLMAAKGREVEAGIVRLSQLARAVGIHLVVATQRPSVDVITGLIKANLTCRVAFQVASQVDSRTILDSAGAETLLGRGDMLYVSSEFGKPKRIQGCYIFQKDVKKVVDFIKKENTFLEPNGIKESLEEELEGSLESKGGPAGLDFEDPLYGEAESIVKEYKRASASLLQRRLKIGYARAARLLDMLEERGIVGPADGAKPRQVFGGQSSGENFDSKVDLDKEEKDDDSEWEAV